jgi:hypothetical protein
MTQYRSRRTMLRLHVRGIAFAIDVLVIERAELPTAD